MLSEDSDSDTELQLTINEHYAKAYAYKKEREELGKRESSYSYHAQLLKFCSERKVWIRCRRRRGGGRL